MAVVLLSLFVLDASLWAGLGSDKAMYVGGTVSALKEKDEGKPVLDDKSFTFEQKGSKFSIPYEQINSIEYGQKAGRRVGMAIVVSPLFIFSHKRRHFLTIGFLDKDKKQQAAVFELGKSAIKPTLSGLEAKTGKKVDYEDAEARKSGTGGY